MEDKIRGSKEDIQKILDMNEKVLKMNEKILQTIVSPPMFMVNDEGHHIPITPPY